MFDAGSIIGLLLSFLLSSCCISPPPQPPSANPRPRLLSAAEGDAIVQAAWELRRGLPAKPDCSHFVNVVYARAGFPYEYAQAKAIFAGIAGFRRVRMAQPGDLVVWQSHMGIVIDPREHSFYSSVLSGFAIENYQSGYWTRRGDPRFYRFVVNDWPKAPQPVLSSSKQVPPASSKPPALIATKTDLKTAPPIASKTATAPKTALKISPEPAPKPASKTAAASREVSGWQSALRAGPAVLRKAEAVSVPTSRDDEIFVTSRATPSRSEILAAIIWSANDNGERLLRNRLLESQPSVGVADSFRIAALDLEDKHGLAEVEVKEIAAFHYGKPYAKQSIASQRVVLSRQEQGWVLLLPQALVYLNRRLAAMALTNRLASLSQAPADRQEVKTAAKILHDLKSEKSAGPIVGSLD